MLSSFKPMLSTLVVRDRSQHTTSRRPIDRGPRRWSGSSSSASLVPTISSRPARARSSSTASTQPQDTLALASQRRRSLPLSSILDTDDSALPPPPGALARCPTCNDFDPYGHKESKVTPDGAELTLLFTGPDQVPLQKDCKFCQLIQGIEDAFVAPRKQTGRPSAEDDLGADDMFLELFESRPHKVEFRSPIPVTDDLIVMETTAAVIIYVNEKCPDIPYLGPPSGNISSHSGSDSCFQFVTEQLQKCTSSHTACSRVGQTRLPKRVLSIENGSERPKIKLLETRNECASYAALSHCWGKHQPLKATGATLRNLTNSVPWDDLSAVFKDAVTVCERLGIQYLWIDSLCIIQDCEQDWEAESAKMCDYYENAIVTISAATSADGSMPFLRTRSPRWQPKSFTFDNNDGTTSTILAREQCRQEVQNDHEPLTSRAWAWQEGLLSSRIVHYTASGVIWSCRQECIAEDGSDGRRVDNSHMNMDLSLVQTHKPPTNTQRNAAEQQPAEKTEKTSSMDIWDLWLQVVSNYSMKDLTFATDRLPALGGIASMFSRQVQVPYLAGHWEEGLVASLCWEKEADAYSEELILAPSEYIAPSWSWASLSGDISWLPLGDFKARTQVLDAHCEVPGLNPFGRVSSGYIVLRGPAVVVPFYCEDARDEDSYDLGNKERTLLDDDSCMTVDSVITDQDGQPSRAKQGMDVVPYVGHVWCLLLGDADWTLQGGVKETRSYALVLDQGDENETHHRLGILRLSSHELFEDAMLFRFRIS